MGFGTSGSASSLDEEHLANERVLLRLLASGRLTEVDAALSERGVDDLVSLVAATDARARLLDIDAPGVQEVLERVEDRLPADHRLRFWCRAVLAERLLLAFDSAVLLVVAESFDEIARCELPILPPLALRYARARLARVESIVQFGLGASDRYQEMRDLAVAELLACGFLDEVHLTRGVFAGAIALVAMQDIMENYDRLLDARAALADDVESIWPGVLDVSIGFLAAEMGDVAVAVRAFDRLDQGPRSPLRLDDFSAYGRAYLDLVTAGASTAALAEVERALAAVRNHSPRIAQGWHGHVAQALVDLRSPAAARFARLEAELPTVGWAHDLDRKILGQRVEILGGASVTAADLLQTLERLALVTNGRWAGRHALRLAHDLAAAGGFGAEDLLAWGRERVPTGEQATYLERWWSRSLADSAGGGAVVPPLADRPRDGHHDDDGFGDGRTLLVRVLAPAAEVVVDGTGVELSPVQTKLLVALAIAHPAPLHVEQASDLLWPDERLSRTRGRLNSLVHRLRIALGRQGSAVTRAGDLLQLDRRSSDVDLWRFRVAMKGGSSDRRRALLSVRGNLCDAQFPYDERFVDERHRLCGEWLRHAREASQTGEVEPAELEPAMTALRLTSEDW